MGYHHWRLEKSLPRAYYGNQFRYNYIQGIASITFNSEYILLFSAGFDHDICVWNPYIGKTNLKSFLKVILLLDPLFTFLTLDTPVNKIPAHNGPIVSIEAIPNTS